MLNIISAGHAHPESVIDNAFLESLDIGTTNEWIMERVGIETRRSVLPLDYIRQTGNTDPKAAREAARMTAVDLAVQSAEMAVQRAGIKPADIGMVVAGTCVPQMQIPPLACLIASHMGIRAPSFDLNSACSACSAQLHFLNNMKPEELPDYILMAIAETMTLTVNFKDRSTAVLFGDGAASIILSPRHPGKAHVVSTYFESDPSGCNKVLIPPDGHFQQEGSAVQRFAILQTAHTYNKLKEKSGVKQQPYFIGHQANFRMLQTVCERLSIPSEKHFYNINKYGNVGGAGAPTVLSQNWDSFLPGDDLALVTVGAGLSWGGAMIHFREAS
jgi:3-oxoacyl-[acyl-carrier-protein] synthase III